MVFELFLSKLLLLERIGIGDGYTSDARLGVKVLRLSGIIRQAFIILTYGTHVAITYREVYMIKAYIFDFLGVLITYEWENEEAVYTAKLILEEMGFDREWLSERNAYNELFNDAVRDALVGRIDLPAHEVRRAINEVYDCFDLRTIDKSSLRENVKDTLIKLRDKGTLGVYTTLGRKGLKRSIDKFELHNLFEIVVTRDDVTVMKPYEEGLRLVLYCLNISPQEMIFIGDHARDLSCSIAVGGKTAFFASGEQELQDLLAELEPDYILNALSDLLQIR